MYTIVGHKNASNLSNLPGTRRNSKILGKLLERD